MKSLTSPEELNLVDDFDDAVKGTVGLTLGMVGDVISIVVAPGLSCDVVGDVISIMVAPGLSCDVVGDVISIMVISGLTSDVVGVFEC